MNKVVQSFSNSGKPHDNAVSEAFFANMKKEELYRGNYRSGSDFQKALMITYVFSIPSVHITHSHINALRFSERACDCASLSVIHFSFDATNASIADFGIFSKLFNSLFVEQGWIAFEPMNFDMMKRALDLGE